MGIQRKPTHECTKCGALWILLPGDEGWSLFSLHCGPCCDNAAMENQIKGLPTYDGGLTLHPSVEGILQFFKADHLPPHLFLISQSFAELAWRVANGRQNAETTAALRKLLEAKDCAVRALIAG